MLTAVAAETTLPIAPAAAAGAGDLDAEAALVARLRRGDEAAFEQLVRTYGGRLLAVARRLTGSEEDARDAVQEALLAAFRALPGFEGRARLGSWLHRIAVNAALMKLRRPGRRREVPWTAPAAGSDGSPGAERPAAVRPATAEEEVLAAERGALVRRAIAGLPAGLRVVLLLRDIEELSTEETAHALGISANAVKIRLHRARRALGALLGSGVH